MLADRIRGAIPTYGAFETSFGMKSAIARASARTIGNTQQRKERFVVDKKVSRAEFNERYLQDLIAVWKKMGRATTLRLEGPLNAQLARLRRWKWPPLRT